MFINFINDVQKEKTSKDTIGYASKTLYTFKRYFSTLLNDAVDAGVIPANRIAHIHIKDGVPARPVQITIDQYQAAIAAAEKILNKRELASFYLALFGLRHSEILGMRPIAIFNDHCHVSFTRTAKRPNGQELTKTSSSKRDVPYSLKMYNLLNLAIEESKQIYLENEKKFTKKSFIFVSEDATPLNYTSLNYTFTKVSAQINFHIFPHMMRHAFSTFGSMYAKDQKDVMNMLGHTNLRMTQEYDSGTKQGQREIVDKMDKLMQGGR